LQKRTNAPSPYRSSAKLRSEEEHTMNDLPLTAPDQSAGTPKPKRVNRGYALREDLIKELKLIAVYEDRNLYQVMEEAIEQYLERRDRSTP
jgi:hypothetical protein